MKGARILQNQPWHHHDPTVEKHEDAGQGQWIPPARARLCKATPPDDMSPPVRNLDQAPEVRRGIWIAEGGEGQANLAAAAALVLWPCGSNPKSGPVSVDRRARAWAMIMGQSLGSHFSADFEATQYHLLVYAQAVVTPANMWQYRWRWAVPGRLVVFLSPPYTRLIKAHNHLATSVKEKLQRKKERKRERKKERKKERKRDREKERKKGIKSAHAVISWVQGSVR